LYKSTGDPGKAQRIFGVKDRAAIFRAIFAFGHRSEGQAIPVQVQDAQRSLAQERQRAASRPFARIGALRAPREKASGLLDFLEHLEDALRRAGEEALVGLAEAATLEGIPAGSGSFGHGGLLIELRNCVSGLR
jgi:hypothetical protein